MSNITGGGPGTPPGWYPDGQGNTRWWDGSAWTESVQQGGVSPDGPATPTANDEAKKPWYKKKILWVVAAVLIIIIAAGAGGGSDDDSEPAASQTTAAEQSHPAEVPSDAAPLTAMCKLKGSPGGTATLEQTDDGLVMTFAGLSVSPSGTVLYSVTAFDDAGENGGQLGVKYQDSEQVGYFVFDFGTAEQTNLEGSPQVSGDTVTASVADADLGPLSEVEVASWSAAYSVNGKDVGTCPGGIESLPFPG